MSTNPNTIASQNDTIRILIVEDHELARRGLTAMLEEFNTFDIVGEAENGEEAVSLALENNPDVVLMDIGMPVMDGITATQKIKEQSATIKVVMLTSHQEGEEVYAALAAGADAYCMKDIKIERLCQVIEMVQEGAIWLDPAIAKMVMQALPIKLSERGKQAPTRQRYNAVLTEREVEVLRLIVAGKNNKEIAEELSITIHTAKAHVCNIIQKLAVDDRTQAAVKALRDGYLS